MSPLITSVLDLNAALGGNADLLLGGGLGLYLKQEHLRRTGARTLLPLDRLPPARTTQDIDLFLRAEVIDGWLQLWAGLTDTDRDAVRAVWRAITREAKPRP